MPARVAALEFLSVLDVRGEDAAAFLHAQLCGDVLGIPPGQARFTAWCTPKGRVIASFLLARGNSGFRMILCRDIAARVVQKLRLYILRSRVELGDRGAGLAVAGVFAPATMAAHEWEYSEQGDVAIVSLPGSNGVRALLSAMPATLAAMNPSPEHAPGWIAEDALTGLPWIGAALSEEFLPQELDLEHLGGLSYTKGCYPGQEIVTRVHSRGRLKRGLRRFTTSAESTPGTTLVTAAGAIAGRVIASARAADTSVRGLAVVELDHAAEPLRIGEPGGAALRLDASGHD